MVRGFSRRFRAWPGWARGLRFDPFLETAAAGAAAARMPEVNRTRKKKGARIENWVAESHLTHVHEVHRSLGSVMCRPPRKFEEGVSGAWGHVFSRPGRHLPG